jgi:hypothetical protein
MCRLVTPFTQADVKIHGKFIQESSKEILSLEIVI